MKNCQNHEKVCPNFPNLKKFVKPIIITVSEGIMKEGALFLFS